MGVSCVKYFKSYIDTFVKSPKSRNACEESRLRKKRQAFK